jgi:hypothetical protein
MLIIRGITLMGADDIVLKLAVRRSWHLTVAGRVVLGVMVVPLAIVVLMLFVAVATGHLKSLWDRTPWGRTESRYRLNPHG